MWDNDTHKENSNDVYHNYGNGTDPMWALQSHHFHIKADKKTHQKVMKVS